jgi:dTDP-4-dehydrorhamnose reductase
MRLNGNGNPDLKTVIVGRSGQLAWELNQAFSQFCPTSSAGRPELDLSDFDSIRSTIRALRPSVLINAAAYTAVDLAESEPEAANRINADAQAVMAEEAKRLGALFISYSTDYVFDGQKNSPYQETDEPAPLNVYGASKLAGERAVQAAGGAYLMLRTSWVYGARGKNFLNTILRLSTERPELRIVDDQIGAPTWSRELAIATKQMILQLAEEAAASSRPIEEVLGGRRGIYHTTAGGSVSWYGFASAILEERIKQSVDARILAKVTPITSNEYPTPARRPRNSRLSNEKLQKVFGIMLPHWRESLCGVMSEVTTSQQVR